MNKRKRYDKNKIYTSILGILFIATMITGILLGPLKDVLIVKVLHKLISFMFCILAARHIIYYRRKR